MNYYFLENSYSFVVLVCVALSIFFFVLFSREKPGIMQLNSSMKKHDYAKKIVFLWGIRCIILFILTVIAVLLWASEGSKKELMRDNATIIVLDLSRSMKADDVSPSRLEYAKDIIKTFLNNDTKSSIGYIVFSGKAFALSPVTDDKAGILSLVESTQTENLEQGKEWTSWSNIGDALVLAGSLLEKKQWEKEILLLTDGRANIGIDPRTVALEMQKKWIKISTIPIWSLTGGILSYKDPNGKRQFFYDEGGRAISAPVDTELLASIARTTGWTYNTGTLLWAHRAPDTRIRPENPLVKDYKKIPLLYLALIILIFLHFSIEFSIAKKSLQ